MKGRRSGSPQVGAPILTLPRPYGTTGLPTGNKPTATSRTTRGIRLNENATTRTTRRLAANDSATTP